MNTPDPLSKALDSNGGDALSDEHEHALTPAPAHHLNEGDRA